MKRESQPCSGGPQGVPHLGVEAIEGHDGPKEEERQVEVVLEQVGQGVVALGVSTALQREAGAAEHREAATPMKQHLLKIKSACYKPALEGREQASRSPGRLLSWDRVPLLSFPACSSLVALSQLSNRIGDTLERSCAGGHSWAGQW